MQRDKRVRIGQADVFDRHAHHAARDVERIFSGFEHAPQPVERGVGIAVAHRLVQRGNQVVMFFAGFVVEQNALLQRVADDVVGDLARSFSGGCPISRVLCEKWGFRQPRRDFQNVVGAARVAAGVAGDLLQHVVGGRQIHFAETALVVGESPPQQQDDLLFSQRLQHIDAAARQQRRVDLERRILGGRADQPNVAFFHVRQKGILLRLVEAVNFVDEDDGARAVLPRPLGVGHDLLDLFDPGQHGGKFDELRLGHVRDDLRERGLARARRSPEDDRAGVVAVDLGAQRLAGADQMLLPDVFIERARTHAVGQRTSRIGRAAGVRNGLEKAHQFHCA